MRRILTIAVLIGSIAGCQSGPPAIPSVGSSVAATEAPNASPESSEPATSGSPSPTGTAEPTIEPTASTTPPTELEYPTELDFANEMAMRVIVNSLNVRARPSTSGAKIGKAPKGSVFLFLDYPVKANGYQWYFGYQALINDDGIVPKLPEFLTAGIDPLAGWVAAGPAESPFLRPIAARCPSTVDLANVEAMLDSETISCFGSDQIELTGTYGCGGCGGTAPGDYQPGWLTYPLSYGFLSVHPELRVGPFALRFPPEAGSPPPDGTMIRVRGHFADARSSTCKVAPLGDTKPEPIVSAVAKAYCRAQFVVDSYDNLGPNPSFPS